ncbi:MAG TPA: hypothetical protein VMN04_07890 [Thermoanaerobaculia bacterium]|nr:hypothetical protein [Thermoanaerobaculia bacterium]
MKTRVPASAVLAVALSLSAAPAHASQWLTLIAPAPNATLPLLAQTVTFQYGIDVHGFRQHTKDFKSAIGVFITVCTGACSASSDMIEYHELGPNEQTSYALAISKIKQHLTQQNLAIGTPIKWNLRFHLPGNFIDPNEVQTNSTFFLGHLEAAGGATLQLKTPTPTPRPIH